MSDIPQDEMALEMPAETIDTTPDDVDHAMEDADSDSELSDIDSDIIMADATTSTSFFARLQAETRAMVEVVYEQADREKDERKSKEWDDYLKGEHSPSDEITRHVARLAIRAQTRLPARPIRSPLICIVPLMLHQREGAGRLRQWYDDPASKGGILADEMGLGKTLTMIAFMADRPPTTSEPALIVVPSSLMIVWEAEFKTMICEENEFRILFIHPSLSEATPKGSVTAEQIAAHNVIIVTHRQFVSDIERKNEGQYRFGMFHHSIRPKYLIVDEAHHAVNPKTEMFKALDGIDIPKKFLITGSPFRNLVRNICAFFKILGVEMLGHRTAFEEAFTQPKEVDYFKIASPQQQEYLNIILDQHMIRRFKENHIRDFPLLTIRDVQHPYQPDGKYSLKLTIDGIEQTFCIPSESYKGNKIRLTQRQLACHPALALRNAARPAEPLTDEEWQAILMHLREEDNFEPGARFMLAGDLLFHYREQTYNWSKLDGMNIKKGQYQRCVTCDHDRPMWTFEDGADRQCMFEAADGTGIKTEEQEVVYCRACRQEKPYEDFFDDQGNNFHRCCNACKAEPSKDTPKIPKTLVYSPFRRALDLFEIHLETVENIQREVIYRIDGTVPQDARGAIVKKFQNNKDPRSVLLASVKCAGEGLNITEANFILFLNVTYCPGNEAHAICRAHRIGQKWPVVTNVLRADECPAEDKLFKRRKVKDGHAQGIVDGGREPVVYVLREEDYKRDHDLAADVEEMEDDNL